MKTAPIPTLRIDPELRRSAESVLRDGETLSEFVEQSLRANIERRQMRQSFIARGWPPGKRPGKPANTSRRTRYWTN